MIKKIAWNTFKNTGDVNAFLEFKQIQNIEEQIRVQNNIMEEMQQQMEEQNGNDKIKWDNNF